MLVHPPLTRALYRYFSPYPLFDNESDDVPSTPATNSLSGAVYPQRIHDVNRA